MFVTPFTFHCISLVAVEGLLKTLVVENVDWGSDGVLDMVENMRGRKMVAMLLAVNG